MGYIFMKNKYTQNTDDVLRLVAFILVFFAFEATLISIERINHTEVTMEMVRR